MPTSANSLSQRLRNASKEARVIPGEEPPPKRTRINKPSDSPASLQLKGPLKQSSEENVTSFVAKSFYGLIKSQPTASDRNNKSSTEKSSDISVPVKTNISGSKKTTCSMSHLDKLMFEKAALSPVKQAVLQTCSLSEFRKMYKDEYTELDEEMKRPNCRMTRKMSQAVNKEKKDQSLISDSSDDEVSFKFSDKDHKSKFENHVISDDVTDLVTGTPPRRIQYKRNTRNKTTRVDQTTHVTDVENHSHDALMDSDIDAEESDELNINYKENSQVNNPSEDSSQKLSTPSSSERRFFKSRSSMDNSKRRGFVFGKGFNLKFTHKSLQIQNCKKKQTLQKKWSGSFSPKEKKISVADNLSSEKSVGEQPTSGFIFAPGFLSPEKKGCDNIGEDGSLHLNKSNCLTYGSASPKQTIAQNSSGSELATRPAKNSSGSELATDPTSSTVSDDTNFPAENWQANNHARKSVPDDDHKLSTKEDTSHAEENSHLTSPQHKFFSIFQRKSGRFAAANNKKRTSDASPSPCSSKQPKDINNSQMIIDAGQKKIGLTQCHVCSMVYCHAVPADEAAHAKFHNQLVEVLKFPGWKKERVVQEYPEDLGRVILVLPDDAKYARKKVEEVNRLMGRELGFPDTATTPLHPYHKVFFYVEDKQITGCCVAESVQEGYRIIPGDLDNSQESGKRPWCCAPVSEPVCVGISRLWVVAEKRKRGVSTKLVDSVRQWYNYGSLIPKHKIAFSDPTPDGRRFAQKYMGTPTFLVYKFSYG